MHDDYKGGKKGRDTCTQVIIMIYTMNFYYSHLLGDRDPICEGKPKSEEHSWSQSKAMKRMEHNSSMKATSSEERGVEGLEVTSLSALIHT